MDSSFSTKTQNDEVVRADSRNDNTDKIDCHADKSARNDDSTDTSKLEKEIDSLVYKLYNLTESEI
ncbi:hypothetical protein [Helicobacter fennelliae]|uniref:hypothetical protein n=1 Tax=Helicobacter fennelliae TaxID=215 RepID=UPI0021ABB4BB|nr:hypothetical protein [Helicobacter fennelliae]